MTTSAGDPAGVTVPAGGGRDRPGTVAVLANRTAGKRRHHRLLGQVMDRLAGGGRPLAPLAAVDAEEAEAACRDAVAGGAGALVAVGGDGTVHAALQAVAGTGVPFAVVPAGTGNDFAMALGYPAGPVAAAEAVAGALRTGDTWPVDLALVTGQDRTARWFGAVFAAGFDAIVNERANRMRWPRGDRRYDLAIFLELVRLRPRRYRLELDGRQLDLDAVLVAVGNTASYGGGIRICPAADPTDGLLDVVVGGRIGRTALVRLRPDSYRGTHVDHPLVASYRARTVVIQLRDGADVDGAAPRPGTGPAAGGLTGYADGERCLPLPVAITCVAGALRVLSPRSGSADPR